MRKKKYTGVLPPRMRIYSRVEVIRCMNASGLRGDMFMATLGRTFGSCSGALCLYYKHNLDTNSRFQEFQAEVARFKQLPPVTLAADCKEVRIFWDG